MACFTLQRLSYRCCIAALSLLYNYFHGKYSDDVQSSAPSVQAFTARTCHFCRVVSSSFPLYPKCKKKAPLSFPHPNNFMEWTNHLLMYFCVQSIVTVFTDLFFSCLILVNKCVCYMTCLIK